MEGILGFELWDRVKFFELDEIMRQQDDLAFARALQHMTTGNMTPEEDAMMLSRVGQTVPDDAVHLFGTNSEIDAFNTQYLDKVHTESSTKPAIDRATGKVSEARKEAALAEVRNYETKDTRMLPYSLILKIGVSYMVTTNINTKDGESFVLKINFLQHILKVKRFQTNC
jgi:hypothetical protein